MEYNRPFYRIIQRGLFLLASILLHNIDGVAQPETGNAPWFEFSDNGKECIIRNPTLPQPWLNRLSNDVFSTWITHQGYIESYLLDPLLNGLTNPQNTSGRFYVRDHKTGKSFLINEEVEEGSWHCYVGLGYNRISNSVEGIETQITYFIPRDDDVLIMLVEITNKTNDQRGFDLFGQVEWNLGDPVKSVVYRGDGRGGSQFNLYKKAFLQENIIYATQNTWRSTGSCEPWPYTGFFAVNDPVTSYETIKDYFLGVGRDYRDPVAVNHGKCTDTDFWSQAEYPWGVLHNTFQLERQEKKTLIYTLGMTREKENIKAIVSEYNKTEAAYKALEDLNKFYDDLILNSITVETPDKENDRILNIWTKYMWRQFYKKSLNDGSYGLGLWSYGIENANIRTNTEQVMLPFDLDLIRNSVINLIRSQNPDTTQTDLYVTSHTMLYRDLGIDGPTTSAKGNFNVPHRHQISGFLFPICNYLMETGEFSLLDKKLPYINGKEATVLDHLQTAFIIATKGLSERGLPRIAKGVGDWNDEFTKISVNDNAESVMLAGELCYLLKKFSEIVTHHRTNRITIKWMKLYEQIKNSVNSLAWDGEWYTRAFSDRADPPIPVGSSANQEGRIYLNAQSWAMLSGIANSERATKSLKAIKNYLMSDYGPMLFYPPYSSFVEYVGTQSIYAPGFRNANIYMRPAGWSIMAAALNNQPELANELYNKTCLVTRTKDMVNFQCEPYAYPENYNGPDHRLKGKGEFQWNFGEGTAWMWYSYVNYILGVRPDIDGLLIDPKIPPEWNGFKIRRPFRGSIYNIEIKNPNHVSQKVRSILIDGKRIKGNVIPVLEKGKEYNITVMM